jgi:hypothetical protein
MPTQQFPREELAWSNCVKIHRTTENDDASYSVEFVYPSDGGDASINELLRNCLNDFVKQLPKKLPNGSQSAE